MQTDDSSMIEPPSKKHKKHKKKHKRRRECEDESTIISPKSSIKLKLKIGSETMGTKNFASIVPSDGDDISEDNRPPSKLSEDNSVENEEEMSEEEKWLNALEKGTLNSYGEIGTAKKDPAQLTARQKALLHGQQDELLQLPSGYKTVELTDEQKQLRQEKAKRRREQANEKIENDKNQTVHKLLKKQDNKSKRSGKGRGGKRANIPRVMYKDNHTSGLSISLPADMSFPLAAQTMGSYPEPETCGVEGCSNKMTSVCSKSLVPVCGLQCYKANLLKWSQSQSDSSIVVPSTSVVRETS